MIDLLTAPMCRDCFALKTAFKHYNIDFREIDIKTLGPEEEAEKDKSIAWKLTEAKVRHNDFSLTPQLLNCAPMVRIYQNGQPVFIFQHELINGGCVLDTALYAIRQMIK